MKEINREAEQDRLAEQVEHKESTIKLLLSESRTLRAQIAELKKTIIAWALGVEQSNTDIVDMQRDEFRRIIALTDSQEIKGICERAMACIEQTVPVVVQRDQLQKRNAELQQDKARLLGHLQRLVNNINEFGRVTDAETLDYAQSAIDAMQKEGK